MGVLDPTCGSGTLLLASAQDVIENHGVEALNNYRFCGVDLDMICAKMCAVQFGANMVLRRIGIGALEFKQGNSLGYPSDWIDVLSISKIGVFEDSLPSLEIKCKDDNSFGNVQIELF